MYLEQISMVHCVQGDISRTAAPESTLLELSLWRLVEPGRLSHQSLAVIAVDLAHLLRRQLRKPHLTGVALNQCSSAPCAVLWVGGDGGAFFPPCYSTSRQVLTNRRFCENLWDSYTSKATANPPLNKKLLISYQWRQYETQQPFI